LINANEKSERKDAQVSYKNPALLSQVIFAAARQNREPRQGGGRICRDPETSPKIYRNIRKASGIRLLRHAKRPLTNLIFPDFKKSVVWGIISENHFLFSGRILYHIRHRLSVNHGDAGHNNRAFRDEKRPNRN
jgi:hypothetical protein